MSVLVFGARKSWETGRERGVTVAAVMLALTRKKGRQI